MPWKEDVSDSIFLSPSSTYISSHSVLNDHRGAAELGLLLLPAVHITDHCGSNWSSPSPASRIVINNQHQEKELTRIWEGPPKAHLHPLSYFPFARNATEGFPPSTIIISFFLFFLYLVKG